MPKGTHEFAAFISYSHQADLEVARLVHAALIRFAYPWYRRRPFRIFRDEAVLPAGSALNETIEAALRHSKYFILIASPSSAESDWVNREVEYWLSIQPASRILIVLVKGDLAWNNHKRGFDPGKSSPLPSVLHRAFGEEPVFVDLREIPIRDMSLKNPLFKGSVASLAAPLHGKEKDELLRDDRRQRKRFIQLLISIGVILSVSLGVAVYKTREVTREQARTLSLRLATESGASLEAGRFRRAFLEASRSWEQAKTEAAELALFSFQQAQTLAQYNHRGVQQGLFYQNDAYIATISFSYPHDEPIVIWNLLQGSKTPIPVRPEPLPHYTIKGDVGWVPVLVSAEAISPGDRLETKREQLLKNLVMDKTYQRAKVLTPPTRLLLIDKHGNMEKTSVTFPENTREVVFLGGKSDLLVRSRDNLCELSNREGHISHSFKCHSRLEVFEDYANGDILVATWKDKDITILSKATSRTIRIRADAAVDALDYCSRLGAFLVTAGRTILIYQRDGRRWVDFISNEPTARAQFAADGKIVVARALDGRVAINDLQSKTSFSLAKDPLLSSVRTSERHEYFAGILKNGGVGIWSTTGHELHRILENKQIRNMQMNDSFDMILASSGDSVYQIEIMNHVEAAMEHDRMLLFAAASNPPFHFVTGAQDGHAKVWSSTGELEGELALSSGITAVGIADDGMSVVIGEEDGTVSVWDVKAKSGKTMVHDGPVYSVKFLDGASKIITASADGTARLWDRQAMELSRFDHGGRVYGASLSPKGNFVLTVSGDGTAKVWKPNGGLQTVIDMGESILQGEFSPAENVFLVSSIGDEVRVYSLDGVVLGRMKHSSRIIAAEFSADGKEVLSADSGGEVKLWSVDGKRLERLTDPCKLTSASMSDDLRRIATSCGNYVNLWTRTGKRLAKYAIHEEVGNVRFVDRGDKLLVVSKGRGAYLLRFGSADSIVRYFGKKYSKGNGAGQVEGDRDKQPQ
jgi:WD40 repeat protein